MVKQPYPCLWFESRAKEAAAFYCSVFRNSRILTENHLAVTFEIDGQPFMAFNARSEFRFNESVSFVVECDTQKEIDYYWETLSEGGEESMCGWLRDRYGVSWQVVPAVLNSLMSNPEKAQKVVDAFMQMKKFDLAAILAV